MCNDRSYRCLPLSTCQLTKYFSQHPGHETFSRAFTASHSVRLSRARLAVCENGAVVALQHRIQRWATHLIKGVGLGHALVKRPVEFERPVIEHDLRLISDLSAARFGGRLGMSADANEH